MPPMLDELATIASAVGSGHSQPVSFLGASAAATGPAQDKTGSAPAPSSGHPGGGKQPEQHAARLSDTSALLAAARTAGDVAAAAEAAEAAGAAAGAASDRHSVPNLQATPPPHAHPPAPPRQGPAQRPAGAAAAPEPAAAQAPRGAHHGQGEDAAASAPHDDAERSSVQWVQLQLLRALVSTPEGADAARALLLELLGLPPAPPPRAPTAEAGTNTEAELLALVQLQRAASNAMSPTGSAVALSSGAAWGSPGTAAAHGASQGGLTGPQAHLSGGGASSHLSGSGVASSSNSVAAAHQLHQHLAHQGQHQGVRGPGGALVTFISTMPHTGPQTLPTMPAQPHAGPATDTGLHTAPTTAALDGAGLVVVGRQRLSQELPSVRLGGAQQAGLAEGAGGGGGAASRRRTSVMSGTLGAWMGGLRGSASGHPGDRGAAGPSHRVSAALPLLHILGGGGGGGGGGGVGRRMSTTGGLLSKRNSANSTHVAPVPGVPTTSGSAGASAGGGRNVSGPGHGSGRRRSADRNLLVVTGDSTDEEQQEEREDEEEEGRQHEGLHQVADAQQQRRYLQQLHALQQHERPGGGQSGADVWPHAVPASPPAPRFSASGAAAAATHPALLQHGAAAGPGDKMGWLLGSLPSPVTRAPAAVAASASASAASASAVEVPGVPSAASSPVLSQQPAPQAPRRHPQAILEERPVGRAGPQRAGVAAQEPATSGGSALSAAAPAVHWPGRHPGSLSPPPVALVLGQGKPAAGLGLAAPNQPGGGAAGGGVDGSGPRGRWSMAGGDGPSPGHLPREPAAPSSAVVVAPAASAAGAAAVRPKQSRTSAAARLLGRLTGPWRATAPTRQASTGALAAAGEAPPAAGPGSTQRPSDGAKHLAHGKGSLLSTGAFSADSLVLGSRGEAGSASSAPPHPQGPSAAGAASSRQSSARIRTSSAGEMMQAPLVAPAAAHGGGSGGEVLLLADLQQRLLQQQHDSRRHP